MGTVFEFRLQRQCCWQLPLADVLVCMHDYKNTTKSSLPWFTWEWLCCKKMSVCCVCDCWFSFTCDQNVLSPASAHRGLWPSILPSIIHKCSRESPSDFVPPSPSSEPKGSGLLVSCSHVITSSLSFCRCERHLHCLWMHSRLALPLHSFLSQSESSKTKLFISFSLRSCWEGCF